MNEALYFTGNQFLDFAALVFVAIALLGVASNLVEGKETKVSIVGLVSLALFAVAILSNCASAPTPKEPQRGSTSLCLDMLAVACLHAERCGLSFTARQCYESVADQCQYVHGVTEDEAATCIAATRDAPCSVIFADECAGIADRPEQPSPQPKGVSL